MAEANFVPPHPVDRDAVLAFEEDFSGTVQQFIARMNAVGAPANHRLVEMAVALGVLPLNGPENLRHIRRNANDDHAARSQTLQNMFLAFHQIAQLEEAEDGERQNPPPQGQPRGAGAQPGAGGAPPAGPQPGNQPEDQRLPQHQPGDQDGAERPAGHAAPDGDSDEEEDPRQVAAQLKKQLEELHDKEFIRSITNDADAIAASVNLTDKKDAAIVNGVYNPAIVLLKRLHRSLDKFDTLQPDEVEAWVVGHRDLLTECEKLIRQDRRSLIIRNEEVDRQENAGTAALFRTAMRKQLAQSNAKDAFEQEMDAQQEAASSKARKKTMSMAVSKSLTSTGGGGSGQRKHQPFGGVKDFVKKNRQKRGRDQAAGRSDDQQRPLDKNKQPAKKLKSGSA
jgi:hypothetical protein